MKTKLNTSTWVLIVAGSVVLLTLIVTAFSWMACGTNPYTPEGHEGYVYMKPLFLGQGGFVGTIVGPSKYGLSWRKYIINVDTRPQAYKETFKIRMSDNLNVTVDIVLKASPKDGEVKNLVEKLSAEWYERFLQPEFRSTCRKVVARYQSEELPQQREAIAIEIISGFTHLDNTHCLGIAEIAEGNYIEIHSVTVSNVDFPESVDEEIERKLQAKQELEKKQTQLEIAKREAEIRVAEAKGIAQAQEIINKTLTSEYLQHEAIDAMKALAGSPNTTFYFVPTSVHGAGLPIVIQPQKDVSKDE